MESVRTCGPCELCTEGDWAGLRNGVLFRAVQDFKVTRLRQLLQLNRFKNEANCVDGDRAGLLHILAFQFPKKICTTESGGDVIEEIVSIIVNEAGGNVDLRNGQEETPLMLAACYGNYYLARALVNAGAQTHLTDWCGRTALSSAKTSPSKTSGPHRLELCQKTIQLLEAAVEREKKAGGDSSSDGTSAKAELLRQRGNQHYQKDEWEQAIELYTESLDVYEDHRTYGNRSACYLKIAVHKYRNGLSGFRKNFKWTSNDASKAVTMEPKYIKGYYRKAKGYMGYRDLPRAKYALKEGMEACSQSPGVGVDDEQYKILQTFWKELDDLGVPDHISNPLSEEHQDICRKLTTGWMGSARCPWCDLVILTQPLPNHCPFCICDPRIDVDQDVVDQIIVFS